MADIKTMWRGTMHFKNRVTHKFKDLNDTTNEENVVGKVVVITGSNSGIGKVLALHMAKRGAVVVMACRNVPKAENAMEEIKQQVPNANLTLVQIDLSDMESVVRCAKEIKEKFLSINILVNNAGFMSNSRRIERTGAGFEKNLATNYLGHYLLTLHLLDHLKKGAPSRIVSLGSTVHETAKLRFGDLNMEKRAYKGHFNWGPYMNSKRCVMLFSQELGKRLEGTQVRTYSLCPGVVNTELFDQFSSSGKLTINTLSFWVGCTPEQGTETLIFCAVSKDCAQETGKAYHFRRQWRSTSKFLKEDAAHIVWNETETLLGIKTTDFGI